jgi:NAD-dependent DNA ligase
MDKPTSTEIDKFITKYKKDNVGPYIISSKLDGVSGLLTIKNGTIKLYTRGDGTIGTDITNLVPYIIPDIDTSIDCAIRGEIIMSKEAFENFPDAKNARNTVAGVVNAKTVREKELSYTEYIGYEVIEPWIPFNEQMIFIENIGINVVNYEIVDDFDKELLIQSYREHMETNYECDGIIISSVNVQRRNTSGNPKYAFAFKNMDDLETAIVVVKEIKWQVSKDGYINPVINIEPTMLAGVEIKRATGFNAKYIYDNMLGPGAIVEIVRSGGVIPYIKHVIKGAKEPQMPTISYVWNSTEVDIITEEYSSEQKVRELEKFFKELKIKNVAKQSIEKFINADIDTVPKIISITKDDLRKVDSYKETMVNKIYNAIHERMKTITLADLMVATNIFGHGMGRKMIEKVIKEYPDIVFRYIENNYDDFESLLLNIDGFSDARTEWFQNGMKPFLDMLQNIPDEIQDRVLFTFEEVNISNELNGKKFVFTGFRNKEWEKLITDKGGEVTSSVSSKTFAIVASQEDIDNATNNKVKKAIELKCKLISKEEFLNFIN